MQHQMRSKNYPFPTKALNQGNAEAEIIPDHSVNKTSDCVDDGYGGGRGPLDNMRALEHYLPDQHNQRGGYSEGKGELLVNTGGTLLNVSISQYSGLSIFGNNVMKGKRAG